MNEFQEYFVSEFVEDYKSGRMSRRDMMRRVLYISGGVASAAALLGSLGLPQEVLAQGAPARAAAARSPLSVAADDPTIQSQWISYTNPNDGAPIVSYEARPFDTSGPLALVLVCEQNTGLNPHIQDVTRRWAKEGYLAAAPDLLSRQGGTSAVDPAAIPALLSGTDPNVYVGDFAAAVQYYKSVALADTSRIGMNGFCFGGSITWRTAEVVPLRAAAPYYGSVPPLDQVPNITAAVLGVYSDDPNDPANRARDDLNQALDAANVVHQANIYGETHHAFNDDTGQAYNERAALQAWSDVQAWFKTYLRG